MLLALLMDKTCLLNELLFNFLANMLKNLAYINTILWATVEQIKQQFGTGYSLIKELILHHSMLVFDHQIFKENHWTDCLIPF